MLCGSKYSAEKKKQERRRLESEIESIEKELGQVKLADLINYSGQHFVFS